MADVLVLQDIDLVDTPADLYTPPTASTHASR